MLITIHCTYCGTAKDIFPSHYKNNKTGKFYCCPEHSGLDKRNMLKLICKVCRKPFERKPSNGGEFCSHACALEWRWNRDPKGEERRNAHAERMKETSPRPDKETLYLLHVEEKLTPDEIGATLGAQGQTVRNWIHDYDIPFTSRPIKVTPPNKKDVPPEQELRSLYETQHMTTDEMAQRFNVSGPTVRKWFKFYGISARQAGTGLATRGITAPTPEELNYMIHVERLTYYQVADKYGVDFTAVPYWLDKHGIPRPQTWHERHSDPAVVAEIKSMYECGHSLDEIGQAYEGVTGGSIKRLLLANGIPIRKDGWNGGKRFDCLDGHKVRSTYEQRIDDWLHEHGIEHTYEPKLPFSPRHKADFMANGWYIEAWGVSNNAQYKERKLRKIELYRINHAHLIEIPFHSFAKSFNDLWIRRLEQCLTSVE